jgi:DNA-binding IclR family transcriptional regulator
MANPKVASVERALGILLAFRQGEASLSLAELSRRTGLYKSTVLRLAATLGGQGFLGRLADGTFRLGPALLRMGLLYQESFQAQDTIFKGLDELMRVTGESVRFYIRQQDRRVLLFGVDSPQPLREHILPGYSAPIDATSTGQVFARMEAKTSRGRERFPIHTSGIKDPLTSSCAAPLITADGVFLGVISVSGPTARFTWPRRRAAGKRLMEVTAALAAQLRGQPALP